MDLLVPILGQLGYGVDQRVLDSFNLLLRLYGGSLRPSTLLDTVGEFRSGRLDSDARREIALQTKVADRVLSILRLNR